MEPNITEANLPIGFGISDPQKIAPSSRTVTVFFADSLKRYNNVIAFPLLSENTLSFRCSTVRVEHDNPLSAYAEPRKITKTNYVVFRLEELRGFEVEEEEVLDEAHK